MNMKMKLSKRPLNNEAAQLPAQVQTHEPPQNKRRLQWITTAGTLALAFIIAVLYAAFAPAANDAPAASAAGLQRVEAGTPTPVLIELEATATPESVSASIHISQYTQLQVGDDYPAVQQLQSQLSALGYLDTDEPDTMYSAALADAVSMFQRAHGLEVNGEADATVQEKLFEGEPLAYQVRLGDEGDDVSGLQTALADLGYFSGKTTGYFGTATEAAVLAFQQKNGLAPDGVFDVDDRDLLYSPQAKPTESPASPTPTKRPAEKTPAPQKPSNSEKTTPPAADPAVPTTEPLPLDTLEPFIIPELEPPPVEAPPPEVPNDPPQAPPEEPDNGNSGGGGGSGDTIEGIIDTALAQVGKPYRRGNEGPNSYDCSGLIYYCLTQNGVSIGRYNAASYSKVGDWKKISSMSSLKRGDLIFFHDDDSSSVSHVGICLGDGTMVDASSSKSQITHRSHTTSYWKRNFVCGRRVIS